MKNKNDFVKSVKPASTTAAFKKNALKNVSKKQKKFHKQG